MAYEGNCHLGDLFESRREKGRVGLPLISVTLNDGLVDRDELERKQESSLSPEEHLLVKPGDIVYNMMRMWQGASGLSDKEGMVSPAYVVLVVRDQELARIDPQYAAYMFKSPRMVYLLWAYSHGLTSDRLRLYFDDFARIPASIPNTSDQKRIARILTTTDREIRVLDDLLESTRACTRALVQQLTFGKRRLRGFSGKLKKKELDDFCARVKENVDPAGADKTLRCIELENLQAATGQLLGSACLEDQTSTKSVFAAGDVLFGKLRPYLKKYWLADSGGYCSTEIWVLRANRKKCLPEYLYLICQSDRFSRACHAVSGSKMPRAEWSVVSNTPFILPPIEEQRAIVDVVSASASVFDALTRKREGLIRQKLGLLQTLFSSSRRGEPVGQVRS